MEKDRLNLWKCNRFEVQEHCTKLQKNDPFQLGILSVNIGCIKCESIDVTSFPLRFLIHCVKKGISYSAFFASFIVENISLKLTMKLYHKNTSSFIFTSFQSHSLVFILETVSSTA